MDITNSGYLSLIKEELLDSKAYKKVLRHRRLCYIWQDYDIGKCFECFGGGLTKFVMNLLSEEKFVKEIVRLYKKLIE